MQCNRHGRPQCLQSFYTLCSVVTLIMRHWLHYTQITVPRYRAPQQRYDCEHVELYSPAEPLWTDPGLRVKLVCPNSRHLMV